jgi:hypothetical protein
MKVNWKILKRSLIITLPLWSLTFVSIAGGVMLPFEPLLKYSVIYTIAGVLCVCYSYLSGLYDSMVADSYHE